MSSKFIVNSIGTALVLAMLTIGCVFGYAVLGGNTEAPAGAVVPTEKSTSCLICVTSPQHGSGGSNSGTSTRP